MVKVKIINYEVFDEGLISIDIVESTTIYEILKKVDYEYGVSYEKRYNRKLIEDIVANYRIFLNNNYVEYSDIYRKDIKNEDYLLVLKPISGG